MSPNYKIGIIVAIICYGSAQTTADAHRPAGWGTCQGTTVSMEKISTANSTCMTEMKDVLKMSTPPTPKEIKKNWKNTCFLTCIFEKLGVLTPTGSGNTTGIASYLNSTYQGMVKTDISTGIGDCIKHSSQLSKSEECKTYKPLNKCILKTIKNACTSTMTNVSTMAPGSGRNATSLTATTVANNTAPAGLAGRKRRHLSTGPLGLGSEDTSDEDDNSSDT